MDMAGFAFNLDLLFTYQDAYIDPESRLGFLETDFLKKLRISLDDVEAKADDCTRVSVLLNLNCAFYVGQNFQMNPFSKHIDSVFRSFLGKK